MLGKIEGRRRRYGGRGTEDEMVDGIMESTDMSLSQLWETVKDREDRYAAVHGAAKSST